MSLTCVFMCVYVLVMYRLCYLLSSQEPDRSGLYRSREPGCTVKGDPCDVAFLAHPSSILSAYAMWMPEKRPKQR